MMIDDPTRALLGKMMELSYARQNVLANNLANLNTPGYTRQTVDFGDQLARIVRSGEFERLGEVRPRMREDNSGIRRQDGNNVDPGRELNELMQNGIYHRMITRAMATKSRILRTAMGAG